MTEDDLNYPEIASAYGIAGTSWTAIDYIDVYDIWIDSLPETKEQKFKAIIKIKEVTGQPLAEVKSQLETLPYLIKHEVYESEGKNLARELQPFGVVVRLKVCLNEEELQAREEWARLQRERATKIIAAKDWYKTLSETQKEYVNLLNAERLLIASPS